MLSSTDQLTETGAEQPAPAAVTDLLGHTFTLDQATGRYVRLDVLPYFAARFRGVTLAALLEQGPLIDVATGEYVPDEDDEQTAPAPLCGVCATIPAAVVARNTCPNEAR